MKNYSELKSGTDIRGFASDIYNNKINLTDEAIYDISSAFVVFLSNKSEINASDLVISVGHDSRITANRIKNVVIDALVNSGVTVIDCGLSSTPAMFMTTVLDNCNGAIQITASHHPADRNGLKFFMSSGGLDSKDITEIINFANNDTKIKNNDGKVIKKDFMKVYSAHLRTKICEELGVKESDKPLKNFKIVVDAGNGAGGFYAKDILEKLGADTTGSVYLEPDGYFPNHIPNPEDATAMKSICNAVLNSKADLGLIFDTDVDRAACVGSDGCEINRNSLIALASTIVLENNPNATIVTDSVTSDGLKEFIENKLGGKHHRFKRGYKNVINEAIRLCDNGINAPLAIETSGHAALKENYFLDDGAYLVTKIIITMIKQQKNNKSISDLIADLKIPVETKELRFNILEKDFKLYGEKVINDLFKYCESDDSFKIAPDNHEGIRVNTEYGWFLLRLSVHDPNMPLNIESDIVGGTDKIIGMITPFFEKYDGLNTDCLKK